MRTQDRHAPYPHYVYRYFAADGSVLYIGCTYNLKQRDQQHATLAPWYHLAVSRSYETYQDRWHGLVAERTAIICNRPQYNKTYNYWTPSDPWLTRELHRLVMDRPSNAAELLVDIERRVYEQECADQRARDAAARASKSFDTETYDRLRNIGVKDVAARRWARQSQSA